MTGPCLLCAATVAEARACARAVAALRDQSNFEILRTGMGPRAAESALRRRLAADLPRPRHIISTGFAGSLSREIPVGAWVTANEVRAAGKPTLRCEAGMDVVRGERLPFHSVATLQAWPEARAAVDMESYALAEVAQAQGLPWSVYRLISDNPDQPLPASLSDFASVALATGWIEGVRRAGSGALALGRDPRRTATFIFRMIRLGHELSRGLGEFLEKVK